MLLKRISMRFCIFVPLKIPFLFVPPPIPILHQLLMWINGSNLPCIIPDSRSLSDDKKITARARQKIIINGCYNTDDIYVKLKPPVQK